MKRTHLFNLLFLITFVVAGTFEAFAYNFEVNGIYYNINSGYSTVYVTYKNTSYNSYSGVVTIPQTVTYNNKTYSVTSIGNSAFYGCTGLTSVTIPNSVTAIGQYAFSGCTGLTSVIIEGPISIVKNETFKDCRKLKSVSLPYSVTLIENNAFYFCEELTDFTCLAKTPPVIERYNSIYPGYYMATLHVPQRSVEAYRATDWWSHFISIVGDASDDNTTPADAPVDKCDTNDDGEVNIADVNRVINAILNH